MSEMTESDIVSLLRSEAQDFADPVLKSGDHVGAWTVTAFLGGGGFGEVYRVVHSQIGLACALKLLKDLSETSRARFLLEARVLARQLHPGIPRFYETGEVNGRPYLVMELLVPRELPVKEQGIANLAFRLCSICQSLHAAGLAHRDIKPENVLYRESGEVVLADYGLVK
jgi:eukaryotic-like serine/threonine-protein kinase